MVSKQPGASTQSLEAPEIKCVNLQEPGKVGMFYGHPKFKVEAMPRDAVRKLSQSHNSHCSNPLRQGVPGWMVGAACRLQFLYPYPWNTHGKAFLTE